MKKFSFLTLLVLTIAIPLQAQQQPQRGKNQSYFSFDDGGTIVRQAEEGKEIDGRINMPVFPGDEVTTSRRGRAEVRLADGNVLGIDRASAVLFRSVLNSYDGSNEATVVELRYGKLAVYRTVDIHDSIRLDTPSATYFAAEEAIFSVETDTNGVDRASVFAGSIEVRTPAKTSRLKYGESASVDQRGLFSIASGQLDASDDFERWFLRRADKWANATSTNLDSSLAVYEDDLNSHGSWTSVSGYGNVWRPSGVSASWRPYYYGQWTRSYSGSLVWVSYEPWGWAPYHFGRWAYDPYYGWFWVPGSGYAPAWVYWMYGNGYAGWAPAGYYDCYRPYYNWAYRPYHNAGYHGQAGFGFYGRVRGGDVDLRPWTFVDGGTLVSTRIDRAALTTDVVRGRLQRDNGGLATVTDIPARFTRADMKDPAAAINRRWTSGGVERGSGAGSASQTDMTPFFRRDPELSSNVRDRITRTRPGDGGTRAAMPVSPAVSGSGGNINRGGLAPIGGGSVAPIGGGGLAPIAPTPGLGEATGRMRDRTDIPRTDVGTRTETPRNNSDDGSNRIDRNPVATPEAPRNSSDWRDRVGRTTTTPRREVEQPETRTEQPSQPAGDWRTRVARGAESRTGEAADPARSRGTGTGNRDSDVSRRVIDRIGGARVTPSSGDSGRSRSAGSGSRDSGSRSVDRPKDSTPSRSSGDSGKSSTSGKSSGSSDKSSSSGSSPKSDGGRVQRNH